MEKVALVTGASRGIGRAIALALGRAGYAVTVNYRTHREEAEKTVSAIEAEGGRAFAFCADVADKNAVAAMVQTTENRFGRVSLLVNNAGIAAQSLFQDVSDAEWERMLAVNLGGARHCINAVLPGMLHEKAGCIVNLASVWGQHGASCEVAYSCTKHAIVGLTRSLAMELAPSGIRVNAVAPGVIRTEMTEALGEETLAALAEQTPLGRLGTPEDIAEAVLYLANAPFVTGQVLAVDGAFVL